MEKEWPELTPEERREQRFNKWLSPDNVTFDSDEAKSEYRKKANRIIDAINLKETDRVPVVFSPGYVPARYSGYTVREVMYDSEKLKKAWLRYMNDFELDVLPTAFLVRSCAAMETLGLKTFKWAGCGLPDNTSPQAVETELLKADEWEAFMNDRADFNLRKYLPRMYRAAEPFEKLPALSQIGAFGGPGLGAFTDPEVRTGFEAFARAEKIEANWMGASNRIDNMGLSMGLPNFFGGLTRGGAPLDTVGAALRGTRGTIMDMYKQPDRLFAFMEKAVDEAIEGTKIIAELANVPVAFIPLHRGADGFMSEDQFRTFYWPYLKRVVEGYIEEGLVPVLFAEGGYNSRLELIRDLPDRSVIWHFDQTDIIRAKEVLGDSVCIMGNIPTSLLVTGTPDDVKAYCKKMIRTVGKNGGYILAPGATSDDAKPENLKAMIDASKECM